LRHCYDDLLQTIREVLDLLYGLNRLVYGDIDMQTMRTIATPKTGENCGLFFSRVSPLKTPQKPLSKNIWRYL
jgi:hypothetical protein